MGEKNDNEIQFFEPKECPPFPQVWNNWHEEIKINKLKKMPLKSYFELDVKHHVKNAQPMAPKLTKNRLRYTRYLVSPNKVAILMRSDGRDFMFADRFSCEFLYIVT